MLSGTRFIVVVHGTWSNGPVLLGEEPILGFYTTRSVKAKSVEQAVFDAESSVRDELDERGLPTENLQLSIEEVRRKRIFAIDRRVYRGFSFYQEL